MREQQEQAAGQSTCKKNGMATNLSERLRSTKRRDAHRLMFNLQKHKIAKSYTMKKAMNMRTAEILSEKARVTPNYNSRQQRLQLMFPPKNVLVRFS